MNDISKSLELVTEIEATRLETGMNYLECVCAVCESYNYEIEDIVQLIPTNIKEKIENDALELNMLKYKINRIA